MFEIELIICIKMDLASNNLQRLICHKTQTTNKPKTLIYTLSLFLPQVKIIINSFISFFSFFRKMAVISKNWKTFFTLRNCLLQCQIWLLNKDICIWKNNFKNYMRFTNILWNVWKISQSLEMLFFFFFFFFFPKYFLDTQKNERMP